MSKPTRIPDPEVDPGDEQERTAADAYVRDPDPDRLPRVVHAALAVYLLPAFVAVMAVGGVMLVVTKAVHAGSAAANALGLSRRRLADAPWPKRVKAPLADRFGTGSFGPIHNAEARPSRHSSQG